MKSLKVLAIFMLGVMAGIGVAITGHRLHNHINFAQKAHHLKDHMAFALDRAFGGKVRAARMEQVVAPAAYFPSGSIWTQDISHAPLDPQSSAMIAWLADAGGWGNNNKMQIDFSLRALQADASTPYVRFKGPGPNSADSDQPSTFPLPVGGGVEGQQELPAGVDAGQTAADDAGALGGRLRGGFREGAEAHDMAGLAGGDGHCRDHDRRQLGGAFGAGGVPVDFQAERLADFRAADGGHAGRAMHLAGVGCDAVDIVAREAGVFERGQPGGRPRRRRRR